MPTHLAHFLDGGARFAVEIVVTVVVLVVVVVVVGVLVVVVAVVGPANIWVD